MFVGEGATGGCMFWDSSPFWPVGIRSFCLRSEEHSPLACHRLAADECLIFIGRRRGLAQRGRWPAGVWLGMSHRWLAQRGWPVSIRI